MNRWFRMYAEVLEDPKVQRLSGDDFKAWVNLLCLATRGDGTLPPLNDIAFALRIDGKKAAAVVGRLVSAGLIETDGDAQKPHNWNARQYKSDVSTDRVKRFRKRKEAVTETPPDTDSETDSSVDKSTGTVVPLIDPEKVMFDSAIRYLAQNGIPESKARPLIGKWKRDHGTGAVIEALGAAQRLGISDPVGWLEARWKTVSRQLQPPVPL